MTQADLLAEQKSDIRQFWDADPCGSRYLESGQDFEAHARKRYELEPFIAEFAGFQSARSLKVLEIGVGMGADYLEWLKAGAHATGIDLSAASLEGARLRCRLAGYTPDLQVADAENLPFPAESFDVVYSYGVMHHSPDTASCIREAWRVLKPGGQARIMVYHHPSLTGLMLWLRYGIWRGKSLRRSVYDYLESPGTKTYTEQEVVSMMQGFRNVSIKLAFSPGDLLLHQPSARYQSAFYGMVWKAYPRWMVGRLAGRWKLFLLVTATK
ncbi:MAG TPA: class I SAM-dependent methyltransferase [Candidatus Aquilonibacter sp.]|nr:class I SAM-dependent methyltransferase [Candidatus Aquilonibacter sp.]